MYRTLKQRAWGAFLGAQLGAVLIAGGTWLSTAQGQAAPSATHTATMAGMDMSSMDMAQVAKAVKTVTLLHRKVVRVTIYNFAFSPARIVVSPGTKIIWTNKDSDPHTVDSTKSVWQSEALDTDGTFSRTFSKVGAFPYYCSIHPFMVAQVTVKK